MATIDVHPNSKKVYIRRKASMAESAQTGAADFMSLSKKSIGSYLESKNAQGTGSGLSFQEKDILMPYLLSLPKEDREFQKSVKAFFDSLATKIPYGEEGLLLEVGLTLGNDKPVTHFDMDGDKRVYNIPINIMDFVRWRHAKGHPFVAPSLKEATGNPLIQFYLFDPMDVIDDTLHASKTGDEALQSYLKIKDDKDKVWAMLVLLGTDPRVFSGPRAEEQRAIELRKIATEQSKAFNEVYTDKMFEQRYHLQAMINSGIVRRIGSQFIFTETNKIIGNTEEEAMYFFTDPKNSDSVVIMKAQLQEANKQQVRRSTPKTRTPVGR